jgi:hypothetical protein
VNHSHKPIPNVSIWSKEMSEIQEFLVAHIQTIFDGDFEAYRQSCVPELSLYEWHVTPHRIDGLEFHEFMLSEAGREDTAAIALDPNPSDEQVGEKIRMRFDLANYREQVYAGCAICSYTILISRGTATGVLVSNYNESRVLVSTDDGWKVAHVHKSPSWKAPFQSPPVE